MSAGVWRRHSWWLLPLVAATVVALIGARLVTLSVRERSEQLRRTAQSAVLRHAGRIEGELAALAASAAHPAPGAAPPVRGHFLMSGDASVLRPSGDAATASALA